MTPDEQRWTAYIGLGANLPWTDPAKGDVLPPDRTLRRAAQALGELGRVVDGSCLWRSEPVGPVPDQPPFINGAIALRTALAPAALLLRLQDMERRFGRAANHLLQGPRTLDLDLLLIEEHSSDAVGHGAVLLNTASLVVPHPELARRRFALEPLAEIAPGLCHPLLHQSVEQLLRALSGETPWVGRLAAPGLL